MDRGIDLRAYRALWGREVAASRLLHHLEPQTATIYAQDTVKRLIAGQMHDDATGDVEILDVFWNRPGTGGRRCRTAAARLFRSQRDHRPKEARSGKDEMLSISRRRFHRLILMSLNSRLVIGIVRNCSERKAQKYRCSL